MIWTVLMLLTASKQICEMLIYLQVIKSHNGEATQFIHILYNMDHRVSGQLPYKLNCYLKDRLNA